jgi:hypothetical protein
MFFGLELDYVLLAPPKSCVIGQLDGNSFGLWGPNAKMDSAADQGLGTNWEAPGMESRRGLIRDL